MSTYGEEEGGAGTQLSESLGGQQSVLYNFSCCVQSYQKLSYRGHVMLVTYGFWWILVD